MNDTFLTFPSDRAEALAMLYLQNADLSGASPEDLADMYLDIRARIGKRFQELGNQK